MIFARVSHCLLVMFRRLLRDCEISANLCLKLYWSVLGSAWILSYLHANVECRQRENKMRSIYIYNYWSPNVLGPVNYEWILDYVQLVDLKKNNISISAVSLRSVNFQRMLIILKLLRLRHLVLITKQSLLKIKVFESVKLNWE